MTVDEMYPGAHYHLAWHGFEICQTADCQRTRVDPADEPSCTDPDCEGGCEAARQARELRAGL